jgi:CRISPR/Cas system-associated exonuclease Cas4 (RecB family)
VLTCSHCVELLPVSFWDRLTWSRFSQVSNTYHVTELTQCLTRAYFKRTVPAQETVESAWAKVRGSLLHYVDRSLGWSELRAKMKFDHCGETITVVGHIDAYDPETATIYDLKTSRFVKWQEEKGFIPRRNHLAQIQSYYTLLDSYAIPVTRLVLIYVDDRNILAKEVPLGNRKEWMIQRASILHTSLSRTQIPEPEPDTWCKYCPFVQVCPAKGGGI